MIKQVFVVVCLIGSVFCSQNYHAILKEYKERLVIVGFSIEFEARGEVIKRDGKTVGIIYDDNKILTTSIIFENEFNYRKRVSQLSNLQLLNFSNFKPPKNVKVLYNNKEITAELLQADFVKGVAIVKVGNGTFPYKPLKFQETDIKLADTVIILTLLPVEGFNYPVQLVNCNISIELLKENEKFYQCDKSIASLTAGLVLDTNSKPVGVLSTPISIPESLSAETNNFMVNFYGLSSIVVLPYSQLKKITGEEVDKTSKLWLGLLPDAFSIYYEEKLKDVFKEGEYKVALNIDKVIPDSPLYDSKIYENDLIVEINGEKVENYPTKSKTELLIKLSSLLKPLEFIKFKIYRKSENKFLDIKVVPKPQITLWEQAQEFEIKELGIKVKEATVDFKLQRKLDLSENGFVVVDGINVKNEESNKNFIKGDVIKRIEKTTINKLQDIKDIITKSVNEEKKVISVEVLRGENNDLWNLKIELKK